MAPAKPWPRAAAILDTDGGRLTEADVLGPPWGGRILLGDVCEPDALIDQYFGRGEPTVMLSLDDAVIIGRLMTCWEGSRRSWWLEVDEWSPAH